jgi:hypothetical protein
MLLAVAVRSIAEMDSGLKPSLPASSVVQSRLFTGSRKHMPLTVNMEVNPRKRLTRKMSLLICA